MLAATALLVAVLATGCRDRVPRGKLDDLYVSNLRFAIDEERGKVHVYGMVTNAGDGRFREIEVRAVLRSKGGDSRGENTVSLAGVQPREKRSFSLTVNSAGRVAYVEPQLAAPRHP